MSMESVAEVMVRIALAENRVKRVEENDGNVVYHLRRVGRSGRGPDRIVVRRPVQSGV